jgi:hypothetical protein
MSKHPASRLKAALRQKKVKERARKSGRMAKRKPGGHLKRFKSDK